MPFLNIETAKISLSFANVKQFVFIGIFPWKKSRNRLYQLCPALIFTFDRIAYAKFFLKNGTNCDMASCT